MARWYYNLKGRTVGPLTWPQLRSKVRNKKLTKEAFVRKELSGKWVSAETVPDLFVQSDEEVTKEETIATQVTDAIRKSPWVRRWSHLYPLWPYLSISLGVLGWLAFATMMAPYVSLLSYLCIILVILGISQLLQNYFEAELTPKMISFVLLLCMVGIWGYFDTYIKVWVDNNTRYADSFHRWTGHHTYRVLAEYESKEQAFDDDDFLLANRVAQGPIARSGEQHGVWLVVDDLINGNNPRVVNEYYWYGKKIPETKYTEMITGNREFYLKSRALEQ